MDAQQLVSPRSPSKLAGCSLLRRHVSITSYPGVCILPAISHGLTPPIREVCKVHAVLVALRFSVGHTVEPTTTPSAPSSRPFHRPVARDPVPAEVRYVFQNTIRRTGLEMAYLPMFRVLT